MKNIENMRALNEVELTQVNGGFSKTEGIIGGTSAGAGIGMFIGSIGGPVGALIGAAIGGAVGGVAGGLTGSSTSDNTPGIVSVEPTEGGFEGSW